LLTIHLSRLPAKGSEALFNIVNQSTQLVPPLALVMLSHLEGSNSGLDLSVHAFQNPIYKRLNSLRESFALSEQHSRHVLLVTQVSIVMGKTRSQRV
jgi:hypothetical protein